MVSIAEDNHAKAIVPLTKPSRALQVINQAKKMMGLGGGEQRFNSRPINFTTNININVDGNKGNLSEEKLARLVRQELEKVMKNLATTFDPGVVI
jgi:hypothetical protein